MTVNTISPSAISISPGKRFIFSVNPGRSGSNYLYHILSCADHVCATHEPEHEYRKYSHLTPRLWDLKRRPLLDSYSARKQAKLGQITEMLVRSNADVYVETNPLFCTLWQDVILDGLFEHDVLIIILRRKSSEVLKSLLDLGWFHTRDGNNWMITAYSTNSLIRPVAPEPEASPCDLIIGYLLNVELYAQAIKRRCVNKGGTVLEISSDRLFEEDEAVLDLLARSGLHADVDKVRKIMSGKKNKSGLGNKVLDTPLVTCSKAIGNYLDRCRDKSIAVPELP